MFTKTQFGGKSILIAIGLIIGLGFSVNPAAADTEKAKERFNTGLQLMQEGNDTLAIAEYIMAIKEDPEFVDAYINLGSIYFTRKEYGEAESNFKKATEINAKNPDAFANLGRTYYKQKKYLEAEETYKAALSAKVGYFDTYKDLGLLYHKQKNWPAMVENMMRFTEKVKDDYLSFYLLGKGLKNLKKYPDAIKALGKSIELKADYFNSHSTLGQIYQNQEKHRDAYQAFKKAVEVKPNSYRAYYNLAISYETLYQDDSEKIDKIISNWNQFLKVAKGNPKAKDLIPGTESHVEDLKELKAHYEEEKASKI